MSGHRQEIMVTGQAAPISHDAHVVRAGRLVFVSGGVATDERGRDDLRVEIEATAVLPDGR